MSSNDGRDSEPVTPNRAQETELTAAVTPILDSPSSPSADKPPERLSDCDDEGLSLTLSKADLLAESEPASPPKQNHSLPDSPFDERPPSDASYGIGPSLLPRKRTPDVIEREQDRDFAAMVRKTFFSRYRDDIFFAGMRLQVPPAFLYYKAQEDVWLTKRLQFGLEFISESFPRRTRSSDLLKPHTVEDEEAAACGKRETDFALNPHQHTAWCWISSNTRWTDVSLADADILAFWEDALKINLGLLLETEIERTFHDWFPQEILDNQDDDLDQIQFSQTFKRRLNVEKIASRMFDAGKDACQYYWEIPSDDATLLDFVYDFLNTRDIFNRLDTEKDLLTTTKLAPDQARIEYKISVRPNESPNREGTPRNMVGVMYKTYPPYTTFDELEDHPHFEGEQIEIVPELVRPNYAPPRTDNRPHCFFELDPRITWLRWNEQLSGFVGRLPWYSYLEDESEPNLPEFVRMGTFGDKDVFTLRVILKTVLTNPMSGRGIFEQVIRTRLNVKILPRSMMKNLSKTSPRSIQTEEGTGSSSARTPQSGGSIGKRQDRDTPVKLSPKSVRFHESSKSSPAQTLQNEGLQNERSSEERRNPDCIPNWSKLYEDSRKPSLGGLSSPSIPTMSLNDYSPPTEKRRNLRKIWYPEEEQLAGTEQDKQHNQYLDKATGTPKTIAKPPPDDDVFTDNLERFGSQSNLGDAASQETNGSEDDSWLSLLPSNTNFRDGRKTMRSLTEGSSVLDKSKAMPLNRKHGSLTESMRNDSIFSEPPSESKSQLASTPEACPSTPSPRRSQLSTISNNSIMTGIVHRLGYTREERGDMYNYFLNFRKGDRIRKNDHSEKLQTIFEHLDEENALEEDTDVD